MQAIENIPAEPRRVRRLPTIELCAYVQRRKAVLISLWSDVKVLDFNHAGLTLEADFELQEYQVMTISLELKMEMGAIVADRIPSTVRTVRKQGNKFICTVEFDPSDRSGNKTQLVRIESLLARSQVVADRLSGRNTR